MSSGSRLRAGIAGYGIVGRRRHKCIKRLDRMDVVAVCDRTFGPDHRMGSGVRCYRTYQELLQEPLDVLVVCLTNDVAADVTIAGLQQSADTVRADLEPQNMPPERLEPLIPQKAGEPSEHYRAVPEN